MNRSKFYVPIKNLFSFPSAASFKRCKMGDPKLGDCLKGAVRTAIVETGKGELHCPLNVCHSLRKFHPSLINVSQESLAWESCPLTLCVSPPSASAKALVLWQSASTSRIWISTAWVRCRWTLSRKDLENSAVILSLAPLWILYLNVCSQIRHQELQNWRKSEVAEANHP